MEIAQEVAVILHGPRRQFRPGGHPQSNLLKYRKRPVGRSGRFGGRRVAGYGILGVDHRRGRFGQERFFTGVRQETRLPVELKRSSEPTCEQGRGRHRRPEGERCPHGTKQPHQGRPSSLRPEHRRRDELGDQAAKDPTGPDLNPEVNASRRLNHRRGEPDRRGDLGDQQLAHVGVGGKTSPGHGRDYRPPQSPDRPPASAGPARARPRPP